MLTINSILCQSHLDALDLYGALSFSLQHTGGSTSKVSARPTVRGRTQRLRSLVLHVVDGFIVEAPGVGTSTEARIGNAIYHATGVAEWADVAFDDIWNDSKEAECR